MENVRVAVRVRPFLPNEEPRRYMTVSGHQIAIGESRKFAFDDIFDMDATSQVVNDAVAAPLVSAFVAGYTVSAIAYGQTGAGKTFTMSSLSADVVQRVLAALKEEDLAEDDGKHEFRFSAVEVYNESISDLIASGTGSMLHPSHSMGSLPSLSLREDSRHGVYIQGLSEVVVESKEELLAWVKNTPTNRRTASTLMNATSSRSHLLLTISLTDGGVVSRFGLVDLAGSERIKKVNGRQLATGAINETLNEQASQYLKERSKGIEMASRMREGISINSGLLALGNVIVALCERRSHVPYRASKLTRLLQPMLGGNSKTVMIACVSPAVSSFEETLNTLKYANRAKSIRTSSFKVDTGCSTLEEAERTIAWLRQRLEAAQQASQEAHSPMMYMFPAVEEARLGEVQELLASERKLTQRLQEDLFNAEYTAMIEVEKRKQLEKRLLSIEAQQQRELNEFMELSGARPWDDFLREDAAEERETASCTQLQAESDELPASKGEREGEEVRLSASEGAALEYLSRDIAAKDGLIQKLARQKEEAVQELEYYKSQLQELQDVRHRLEDELSRAEAKIEAAKMERQGKEERRSSLAHHQLQLRKSEEAAEYRRKMQESTAVVTAQEASAEMIKHLQSQVAEMNDELNRHRHTLRERQQRIHKMSVSHAQELNQLQKKLRASEAQVTKLQVQLQKKERELSRVKKGGAGGFTRRQPATLTPQQSPTANVLPVDLSEGVQKEIDIELMSIANLERELDELTVDRDELKSALREVEERTGGMDKWEKAVKAFSMRLQQLERELQSDTLSEQLRSQYGSEKVSIEDRLRQLKSFEPVVAEASRQLVEMESNLDSLQEARMYHLRRVRQLQNGALTSVDRSIWASGLLQRGAADCAELLNKRN
ncbi:putative kinesin [Trypanosoma rangeli]|uniref:Kinesin-like protein n=1 Tax=Trypanosoma rangeli TaxID=5698 RepID=A0A422NE49_TRYRA|nr:putative kinesin [Trypanosoma rangeli]RNF03755.1 putative kinesin [Trypanosoma rangeli]|eukprot:RNF03755.1 putative kinesin [Trypanosoma rangeli]